MRSVAWLWCRVVGHDWSVVPPWSGDDLDPLPECERCGVEPRQIQVAGGEQA